MLNINNYYMILNLQYYNTKHSIDIFSYIQGHFDRSLVSRMPFPFRRGSLMNKDALPLKKFRKK